MRYSEIVHRDILQYCNPATNKYVEVLNISMNNGTNHSVSNVILANNGSFAFMQCAYTLRNAGIRDFITAEVANIQSILVRLKVAECEADKVPTDLVKFLKWSETKKMGVAA